MNTGGSGDVGHTKYGSGEIGLSNSPSMTAVRSLGDTSVQSLIASQISGGIPGASPDHPMMSPTGNIGKHVPFPCVNRSRNPSREFSGSIGNVACKERIDGLKMKENKGGTSIAPS